MRVGLLAAVLFASQFAAAQTLSGANWVDPGTTATRALANDQFEPRASAIPGGAFVVWADRRGSMSWSDVYGARVDSTGAWFPPTGALIAGGALGQEHPSVACGATNCLVVWADTLGGVEAARYSLSASPIDFAQLSVDPLADGFALPSVAAGPNQFLVAWVDGKVHAAIVNADGTVGVPFTVSTASSEASNEANVAFDGTQFQAIWRTAVGIFSATISLTGTVGAPVQLAAGDLHFPRLTPRNGGLLATWVNYVTLYSYVGPIVGAQLSDGGVAGAPATLVPESVTRYGAAPLGSSTLFTWNNDTAPLGLWSTMLDTNDQVGASKQIAPAMYDQSTHALVGSSTGATLVVADRLTTWSLDLRALFLDTTGAVKAPDTTTGLLPEWHRAPTVAAFASGNELLAAYEAEASYDGGATEVRAVRLGLDGQPSGLPWSLVTEPGMIVTPVLVAAEPPWVCWRRTLGVLSPQAYVFVAPILGNLQVGPKTRLDVDGSLSSPMVVVTTPRWAWLLHTEYVGGNAELYGTRFTPDGGLIDVPSVKLSDASSLTFSAAWADDAGVMMAVSERGGLTTRRYTVDGILMSTTPLGLDPYARDPALASDGVNFVVVWASSANSVAATKLDSQTGAAIGTVIQLESQHPEFGTDDRALPSIAWDGREYLVTVDRPSADGGQDVDLVHLGPDLSVRSIAPLASGPGEQERFAVANVGPGRVAAFGVTTTATAGVPRTMVRVNAAVPLGARCVQDAECLAGACIFGACCNPDAGSCNSLDSGVADSGVTDGGAADAGSVGDPPVPGAKNLPVGCGCSSGEFGSSIGGLLIFRLARRRRR